MNINILKNLKCYILFILIIIIVINLVYFLYLNNYRELFTNKSFFTVKDSYLLGKGERGLFATRDYKKGEVIEICPTLKMNHNEVSNTNILNYHFFRGNNKKNSLLALGYCSIINHSDTKQNCSWNVEKDDNTITMYAIKPITKGEELYSNYGKNYWSNKNNKK